MAKRSRKKSKSKGGNPLFMKLLAVVLFIIAICSISYTFLGIGKPKPGLPDNFPNLLLPEGKSGNYADVYIYRAANIQLPVIVNGVKYWSAYICNNKACPGLKIVKGGDKFIFPYVSAGDNVYPECPECLKKFKKVRNPSSKIKYNPQNVVRYENAESREMMNDLIEQAKAKMKRKGGIK